MLYQDSLKKKLYSILEKITSKQKVELSTLDNIDFSIDNSPKEEFGDLSTNIAMIGCKFLKISPIELAEKIVIDLKHENQIKKVEVVRPGFINIFFYNSFWHNQLYEYLNIKRNFNYNIEPKKICLEYVSANPTGLMHIGHARGAVLGDTLSSILKEVGHDVTDEYYINDAGEQINKLVDTINFYLKNKCNFDGKIPDSLYPGDYLKEIAKLFLDQSFKQNKLNEQVIKKILSDIKDDLKTLKVNHKNFISEKKLSSMQRVNNLKKKLIDMRIAYYGFQEKPKNIQDEKWEKKEQFLFCSKKFGDDSDRALIKPNGNLTYFMSDIIYHQNKVERNFDVLINIWGVDHFGYVKRLKNAIKAINKKEINIQIKLTALVNLLKNNTKMKMSKRAGNYITMREVLKEVGTDAIRFTMISRNADKKIDFDLDVFLHKNKDNPVFYIQYAHARCSSVVKIAKEKFGDEFVSNLKNINNLTELQIYEEKQIIKQVCSFYNVIKSSAQSFEPHRISNFLLELAKTFHNYWALGNIDESKRIIIGDDLMVSKSRIHLIVAVKSVIKKGLDLLKIDCPESM